MVGLVNAQGTQKALTLEAVEALRKEARRVYPTGFVDLAPWKKALEAAQALASQNPNDTRALRLLAELYTETQWAIRAWEAWMDCRPKHKSGQTTRSPQGGLPPGDRTTRARQQKMGPPLPQSPSGLRKLKTGPPLPQGGAEEVTPRRSPHLQRALAQIDPIDGHLSRFGLATKPTLQVKGWGQGLRKRGHAQARTKGKRTRRYASFHHFLPGNRGLGLHIPRIHLG